MLSKSLDLVLESIMVRLQTISHLQLRSLLLRSLSINRVKLYDVDPNVLCAFSNSNVNFIVSVGNEQLQNMGGPSKVQAWVKQHIQPRISQTKITSVIVTNEVFLGNDTQLVSYVVPAMKNVYDALVSLGLDKQMNVTTAHLLTILASSFPPSGAFWQDLIEYMQQLLDFHSQTKSPFLINAYPYFAYKGNSNEVPLEYVLFQLNPGMTDPNTNLNYDSMLYALVGMAFF